MALFRALALTPLRASSSSGEAVDWNIALCVLASKAIMFVLGALAGAALARLDGHGRARSRAAAYGLAATCSNDMGVGRPVPPRVLRTRGSVLTLQREKTFLPFRIRPMLNAHRTHLSICVRLHAYTCCPDTRNNRETTTSYSCSPNRMPVPQPQ